VTALPKYLAITGGVGGAKLSLGLTQILPPAQVGFVVNTGDDFTHLGLRICPDLDTLMYALSGESNPETGWGRREESWRFIETLRALGGESWFSLGDRDLAVHMLRTEGLRAGANLTDITRELNAALGTRYPIWPMSDTPVPTLVHTPDGPLAFQHYFVRDRCAPTVTGFEFCNAEIAEPRPEVLAWLADPALAGVFICPSNPYVSIDPILAVCGMRAALVACKAPIIAVSPIVAGLAIKGPTAKMMAEMAVPTSALAVARHYGDLLDGFVIDAQDQALLPAFAEAGFAAIAAPTVMLTLADKQGLASVVCEFAQRLAGPA
jgi:LPPG:FO 2-phospho-L-lactate transferase